MTDRQTDATEFGLLLQKVRAGGAGEADLFELVHADLQRVAAHVARERGAGPTLQPTALVNEVWLKLAGCLSPVTDRHHFLALAARAMRQIIADHARAARSLKRGGNGRRLTLAGDLLSDRDHDLDLIVFHDTMEQLSKHDERLGRIAELRLLGSLTIDEIAEVTGLSVRTIGRDWQVARLWLMRELRPDS